jgi:hypothetical protein
MLISRPAASKNDERQEDLVKRECDQGASEAWLRHNLRSMCGIDLSQCTDCDTADGSLGQTTGFSLWERHRDVASPCAATKCFTWAKTARPTHEAPEVRALEGGAPGDGGTGHSIPTGGRFKKNEMPNRKTVRRPDNSDRLGQAAVAEARPPEGGSREKVSPSIRHSEGAATPAPPPDHGRPRRS